jgi:hypothetical protein
LNAGFEVRYDEGLRQFVITATIPGLPGSPFEGYGRLITQALTDLTEQLEEAGV